MGLGNAKVGGCGEQIAIGDEVRDSPRDELGLYGLGVSGELVPGLDTVQVSPPDYNHTTLVGWLLMA